MQVFKKIGLGLAAMLASLNAFADYSWNFPEPVTPMALDTLHVHNKFMLITMVIFIVVLAIMIYSIFARTNIFVPNTALSISTTYVTKAEPLSFFMEMQRYILILIIFENINKIRFGNLAALVQFSNCLILQYCRSATYYN